MASGGLQLPRFSVGVGDRFAHQAKAQLAACIMAAEAGIEVVPVWNKSNREHIIIGSEPSQTRVAADAAVKALGWTKPYFLDADHINLKTVGRFLAPCDFFTIDVADLIGQPAKDADVAEFVKRHPELVGFGRDHWNCGAVPHGGVVRLGCGKQVFGRGEASRRNLSLSG